MKPFYVLSGPPGAGKTSVLDQLEQQVSVIAEPARRVLEVERASGGRGTGDQDARRFVGLMEDMAISDYALAEGLTVFDRGLPDLLAFCAHYKLPDTLITKRVAEYRYQSKVFWLPSWAEIYRQDEERTLDFEGAQAFGELVRHSYVKSGYMLIDVPKASILERAEFIMQRLDR